MKRLFGSVVLAASAALIACGSGASPTQPTQEGCTTVAADPVAGTQLKAGVPATVTVTLRCTMNAAPTATIFMNGIYSSGESTASVSRLIISRGATTVSLTITFTPPASVTSVAILFGIVYDTAGLPPIPVRQAVVYSVG
jgi:hypothetical protein